MKITTGKKRKEGVKKKKRLLYILNEWEDENT